MGDSIVKRQGELYGVMEIFQISVSVIVIWPFVFIKLLKCDTSKGVVFIVRKLYVYETDFQQNTTRKSAYVLSRLVGPSDHFQGKSCLAGGAHEAQPPASLSGLNSVHPHAHAEALTPWLSECNSICRSGC